MAEGGEVCQIGGTDSEKKEIEEGHGDPFKCSFLKECGALAPISGLYPFLKNVPQNVRFF
jgi:hypothetical protein